MADAEENDKSEMIRTAYNAFNSRDIDRVLSLLSPKVEWPNGWEGGVVHGRAAVRDYWTRQWAAIDPRVDPISIELLAPDVARVLVHQVVRTRDGNLLSESNVVHTYTFSGGLIQKMEIGEPSA
jgi:nuclear transport factor 2 (NTF2) superfamily protein